MLRVVIDTSVVTSAFRSRRGAANALLLAIADGAIQVLATPALFLEYEDVLKRSEQREVSGLSLADVDQILSDIAALIEPVQVHVSWRPQLRDPNDEMVLEAAVNGRANVLVTHNIRDFAEMEDRFGIRVLTPGRVLEELRS